MDKPELRRLMNKRRINLSTRDINQNNAMVAEHLRGLVQWRDIRRMHIYHSNEPMHEVSTAWVSAFLHDFWPHIELVIGEPLKNASIPSGTFDIILVPLLAFDNRLHRLGYGGGWYDRFLAKQPTAVAIGLAHEIQHATYINDEAHDIRLSYVVTEAKVYS